MKVLFAVSNDAVSESIIKKYQQMYKEIIVGKNVYYFNAIYKELQKDKTYDRVVISEDLEPFTNNNYDMIDNFIFERLDNISDEATTSAGEDIPIVLIATDRRTKSDNLLIKLFGIGIYSALLGQDRSIDEVCKLINKPRTKKEAKVYYKIDSNEVEYKPENEDDVSEQEIQNILLHYKKLGRNEDRYSESFDNIASQYTDEQLKVIIKFLPLNVKAVLETNNPKFQQLTSYKGDLSKKRVSTAKKNNVDKAVNGSGIKIESIGGSGKKITKPVIIPSVSKVRKVKVDEIQEENEILNDVEEKIEENFDEEVIETPKRGRGRPRKEQKQDEEEIKQEMPKRGRGRPRKTPIQEEIIPEEIEEEEDIIDYEEEDDDLLPGFEQIDTLDSEEEDDDENYMPGFEDEDNFNEENEDEEEEQEYDEEDNDEDVTLPGFEDDDEEYDDSLFDEEEDNQEYEDYNDQEENEEENYNQTNSGFEKDIKEEKEIQAYKPTNVSLESLLTKDKKVVAFVGTSKNGTSFLVNNLADMMSKQGIKTAILDLTKNKNAYYIYTKNEEELRKIAYSSMEKLSQGIANGIKVNNNLDVYTSLPGERNDEQDYGIILETLITNHSLVILDCDFTTDYGYLKEAQEIYLVQSMDVLTIQPLTAYLRELKAKQVLDPNKLRAVINKATRVKGVTEKVIVGGMAFYNDPSMSFMTELFNRETIRYCSIPFDPQVYCRYLEGLINCNISVNGYPKEFIGALKKLGNMVYPLIGSGFNGNKYNSSKPNKYGNSEPFSNKMNSTLDKMKRNY